MSRIIIIVICCLFSTTLLAQDKSAKEREKIDSVFSAELSRRGFKDTNMVYMFALKVSVAKNKKGEVNILSISASDSSAYGVYRDLKFLKRIDYKLFMRQRLVATFVFPVCIFLEYPGNENSGFVSMQEIQRKMESYWFRRDYHQEATEKNIYIPVSVLRTSTVESI